jgi:WD40 repeat protein
MDLRSGKDLWKAQGSKLRITALAFSPDQKLLASAAGYEEKDIRLWDVAAAQEIGRLEGHASFVASLLFWPDGKRLASSSTDQTIRIWDVASRKCLDILRGSRKEVFDLALLPDQKTLVSGCADGAICVWDAAAAHPKEPQLTLAENVADLCFAPDSQSLVTLDQVGQVTQWSGAGFEQKEQLFNVGGNLTRGSGIAWEEVFSRDGQLLAVGSTNGLLQVWNLPRRAILCQLTNDATSDFVPIAFLDGGRKLLASGNNSIGEWDLRTGLRIRSWPVDLPSAGGVSPDERFCLASGTENHRFMVLDLAGQKNVQLEFKSGGTAGAAFSPDGTHVVLADLYGSVHVFETVRWQEVTALRSEMFAGYALRFSPDGRRLVMGGIGQHTVQLWDTERWEDVLTLQGKGASYIKSAFSADGNTIASLDATGLLQLWHAPSWQEIAATEAKEKGESQQP